MPVSLDELPIHQTPLSMARVASSDRNFYDRSYFNAHDQDGGTFLVSGFGVYPNLGVTDAFVAVRQGDRQWAVRFSDALIERSTDLRVGGYRIEVLEPLQRLRLVCEHELLSADLTWTGSFPAVDEEAHLMLNGVRPTLDAQRFAQVGSWAGTLTVAGQEIAVEPGRWSGSRDRSWGIRPVGEPEPAGRAASEPAEGFYWIYAPLRFDDFAVIVIIQESPDGYRTLNDAKRVWPDGRVEQLGWPRVEITYTPGTRHPEHAQLHLTAMDGSPVTIEIQTVNFIALHVGAGYGGDPDWTHGEWKGANWSDAQTYDLTDPGVSGRIPYGVIDHVARATCNGAPGWGMFEHASMGRHDPSGFADWSSMG